MIYVVGIGPGNAEHMTLRAKKIIKEVDVVVGYKVYIKLIESLLTTQIVESNGMRGEVERCKKAIEYSRNDKTVAVISSGDAGVYGMAGLVLELSDGQDHVEVVPGVTASSAGAAILGAPLMHDYCHISLSDLMTPIDKIMNRVKAAATSDFVICFYNPKSHGRPDYIKQAINMISEIQGNDILVGLAKDAGRDEEKTHIYKIDEVDYDLIDMTTIVIVGNKGTRMIGNLMVTPRGYEL
ncbi:MAG: precorrin-3B C(17)-methyltransferase [Clostridia bacterium]|nr:precorrin-3B C(17)-methyltransferase [Clostridia bacterium]